MALVQALRSHLRDLSRPLATQYNLKLLPDYTDILVISALFFFVVHHVVSPAISRALFPVAYGKASNKTRNNWDAHVVSLVHAVLIVVLSGQVLDSPSLNEDRAFGTHTEAGYVAAIACGYFVWDTVEAILHYTEIGFVLHGLACFTVFLLGSRPFALYYGLRFLFWEMSTIFLNINWFLDKTGRTGSTLQLVNAVALLGTFVTVRLVWGGWISYDFFKTLINVRDQLPLFYVVAYGAGNIMLNLLNCFWFTKMISAIRKRFVGKPSNSANGHDVLKEKEL